MKRVIKSIYFGTPGEADVLYKVSRYSAVGFRDWGGGEGGRAKARLVVGGSIPLDDTEELKNAEKA